MAFRVAQRPLAPIRVSCTEPGVTEGGGARELGCGNELDAGPRDWDTPPMPW